MYWTAGYYSNSKIEVASMDGRNRTVLHDTNLTNIHSLTIDYQRQVLYWTNGNMIECSNVDGSDRRKLNMVEFGYASILSFLDGTLYLYDLSDWRYALKTIDINTGNVTGIVKRVGCYVYRTMDIAVVSEQNQPTGEVQQ